jgi:hypothetical protein
MPELLEAPVFNQLAVLEFHLTIAGYGFPERCNAAVVAAGAGSVMVVNMWLMAAEVLPVLVKATSRHSSTELRKWSGLEC